MKLLWGLLGCCSNNFVLGFTVSSFHWVEPICCLENAIENKVELMCYRIYLRNCFV